MYKVHWVGLRNGSGSGPMGFQLREETKDGFILGNTFSLGYESLAAKSWNGAAWDST